MAHLIYVINGPNLNLLGTREPDIYGSTTLADIEARLKAQAKKHGAKIFFCQSNTEGQIIDWIQEAGQKADGLMINGGAYTHTSVAIHDAMRSIDLPSVEVHLSNLYKREDFRHHSYISSCVNGLICGFGPSSYDLALNALLTILDNHSS